MVFLDLILLLMSKEHVSRVKACILLLVLSGKGLF